AEEALPAHAPVAVQTVDPVLVARPHVFRMPPQFTTARQQPLAESDRLEEPLAARHDLQRTIALLVELHGVGDRPWFADEIRALLQLLDDFRPSLRRREAGERVVETLCALGIGGLPAIDAP